MAPGGATWQRLPWITGGMMFTDHRSYGAVCNATLA